MSIRILPNQIPQLWSAIKFAATTTENISEHDRPLYLNRLLQALLSDKAQCFIRLDENKQLLGIAITRITEDIITGEKSLFINSLYSFKKVPEDQWKIDLGMLTDFAKQNKCASIVSYSSNHRVFEIAQSLGFKECFRCLILNLREV